MEILALISLLLLLLLLLFDNVFSSRIYTIKLPGIIPKPAAARRCFACMLTLIYSSVFNEYLYLYCSGHESYIDEPYDAIPVEIPNLEMLHIAV